MSSTDKIETLPVTVLIATKNEACNIRECLESVAWAQQVILVDSQSIDGTIEIAVDHGAEVHQFYYEGGWPKKRNWALENLTINNPWVLILDADERVSDELQWEIRDAIQRDDFDGYYIKWKFIFLGRWMKHSWSHGWMLRLFRQGLGGYEDLGMRTEGGWDAEVHENVVVEGNCGRLKTPLLHETRQDLEYWIRKQNEFSTWNAKRRKQQLKTPMPPLRNLLSRDPGLKRRWLKAFFIRLPGKPIWMFLYLYVVKAGFLDGRVGFIFCVMRAIHEFNISAKLYEDKVMHSAEQSSS
ncbi:glycosyltransferase family 2 protein [Blastopirellula marina]|uniref:glycosyltransferase family 2 protein n=1 Tax=Blastopirellula marina TaxID=124 RepID=UPI0018EDB48D|nr:glycosyltransferase family 2 protein [Blastopirellula marina]